PARHGLAPEQLQALEPQVQHPFRLVLQGRDVADDVLGQAPARDGAGRVRVGPAELVALQPLDTGLRGCRHTEIPPESLSLLRLCASPGAVTCVVQIPSPWAMVARRRTGVPSSRPNASVSASQSSGYCSATCATGQWCWQSCSPPPATAASLAQAAYPSADSASASAWTRSPALADSTTGR